MSADWLALAGRVAVVTGAGGGIGRATAVALAAAGCRVGLIDRAAGTLAETLGEIAALGGQAVAMECGVSDPDSVAAVARRSLAALGPCDVL